MARLSRTELTQMMIGMFVCKDTDLFFCHRSEERMNEIRFLIILILVKPADPFLFLLFDITGLAHGFDQGACWDVLSERAVESTMSINVL